MEEATPARKARPLRTIGVVALSLLGLLILTIALAETFVRSSLFEKAVKEKVLPGVSRQIHSEVTVESARATLLPRTTLHLQGLLVRGKGERPILRARDVFLRLRLLPTLKSLGRTIALHSATVDGMEANLVRLPDGKWDVPTPPPPKPGKKREVHVGLATIREGIARLVDHVKPLEVESTGIFVMASLTRELFTLQHLSARVAGGRIQSSGRVELAGEPRAWGAYAKVEGMDLGEFPPSAANLDGELDLETELSARSTKERGLERTLSGPVRITLRQGRWKKLNLEEEVATKVAETFHLPTGAPKEERKEKGLALGSPLEVAGDFREGWLHLVEPVMIRTAFGTAEVTGRVSAAKQVDLDVRAGLSPEYLSKATDHLLRPDEPVPIDLRIEGTADAPRVEFVSVENLSKIAPGFLRRFFHKVLP